MSKIIVVKHPETGNIFTPATEGYVKMQIREEGMVAVVNGLIVMKSPVAFPTLQTKVAESPLFKNLKDGDEFPIKGVIQRRLSRVPQYENHETVKANGEVDAKENQIGGKPYYATFLFVADVNAPTEVWVDGEGNRITESVNLLSKEEEATLEASKM